MCDCQMRTRTARSTIYVLIVGRSETQGTHVNTRSRCWLSTRSRSQANRAAKGRAMGKPFITNKFNM